LSPKGGGDMKLRNMLKWSVAAIAATGVVGLISGNDAIAQESGGGIVFHAPEGVCTWDWSGEATPWLLKAIKRQAVMEDSLFYLARNCPERLCDIRWGGYRVPVAFWEDGEITEEMLLWLRMQPFFGDVMSKVTAVCPDVALLMVEGATAAGPAEPEGFPIADDHDGHGGSVGDDDGRGGSVGDDDDDDDGGNVGDDDDNGVDDDDGDGDDDDDDDDDDYHDHDRGHGNDPDRVDEDNPAWIKKH